jgi:DNA adenine methylase
VLLRKPRSYAEIWNDLDGEVVNLFRVLRSDRAPELIEALRLTPFARSEFEGAYEISNDSVEEARRLIIRSFMGFGSDSFNRRTKTGFRANSNRSGTTPAHDWMNYPDNLRLVVGRFQATIIEQRPALEVCAQHDGDDTLHYLDPPYMPETRSGKSRRSGERYHAYAHEMTVDDHCVMLEAIKGLAGAVVLSGYPSTLYDDLLSGWMRVTCDALADGALQRTEVLWINQVGQQRMHMGDLFAREIVS